MKRTRRTSSLSEPESPAVVSCRECMAQAEICCEHARAAAQRKRFTAALGLFRTAQSLYGRAVALGGDACTDARERLQNLSVEIAAYTELARPRQAPVPQRIAIRRDEF